MLIKPLVFRIERRDTDVYDSHFPYGPVAAAGLDENGGERLDRYFVAVEFHLAGTFKNEVDFGQFFMVMHSRIFPNIDDVQSGGGVVRRTVVFERASTAARRSSGGRLSQYSRFCLNSEKLSKS